MAPATKRATGDAPKATPASPPTGIIAADSACTLSYLEQHFGLGVAAMREARRKGLKVRRIGRRGYVLGKDLIAYLECAGQ